VWEIHNFTEDAHPIHIHEVQFQVVDRQPFEGVARPREVWETGFKDTVIAYPEEVTRVKVKFDLAGLYVWHSHIIEHEDNEMMRPYFIGSMSPGVKPSPAATIDPLHYLAADLLVAWNFSEDPNLPRERVADAAPDTVLGADSMMWAGDGAYHFAGSGALEYPSTLFDGLTAFTICGLVTIDVGSWGGPPFPFPNQPPSGLFVKQLYPPAAQPDPEVNQTAFAISYQHADEVDLPLGRDEIWCQVAGESCWYIFKVTGLPWGSQFQQLFLVYNSVAAQGERWIMRIDGVLIPPVAIYAEGNPVVPTTTAPLVLGASTVAYATVVGAHHGMFKYLYAWSGAKPTIWEPLMTDPYAFFVEP